MRYFYDFEFIEDGKTIEPISVGIVAEDGEEYYAVFADAPWSRVYAHEWLAKNVVPHLPVRRNGRLDSTHPDVKPKKWIAEEIMAFTFDDGDPTELWGWYSAYDHVCLMQLWGSMMMRPEHLPMFTHDLKQVIAQARIPDLPPMPGATEHHALQDARELKWRYDLVMSGNAFKISRKDVVR